MGEAEDREDVDDSDDLPIFLLVLLGSSAGFLLILSAADEKADAGVAGVVGITSAKWPSREAGVAPVALLCCGFLALPAPLAAEGPFPNRVCGLTLHQRG